MPLDITKQITNMEQDLITDDFVRHLPSYRRKLGLSQEEFGNFVGLSRQSVSAIERRIVPLTWNTYLSFMMFFFINNNSVFYFSKKNGYKYIESLEKLLKININD